MWTVLDLNGDVLYASYSWDDSVKWAMREGGELDIIFQAWVNG